MKNRIISLFIYLLPSLIYAQNNIDDKYEVLSLTDMLNLFENNEKNVLEYYDKIYVPGYFYEPSLMYPSPLKKEFCCVAQWRIPNRNCKYLFLEDIFPQNRDSLKHAALEFQKIKEKYGSRKSTMYQDVPAGYNGIIAKWFTGKLFVLHCPKKLFNTIVSKKASILSIDKGRISDEKLITPDEGEFESSCFPQKGGMILIREDGCWYDDIKRNIDFLISTLINENFSTEFSKHVGKEYSFLLEVVPKTGQIIPHLLLPKTLSTDEQIIVSYLEKRIRKFPINSFGPLITIDKKMLYGRYFKFIIENKKFKVEDYLEYRY